MSAPLREVAGPSVSGLPSSAAAPALPSASGLASSAEAPAGSASAPPAPPAFRCAPPDLGWGFYLPYEPITGARVSMPILTSLPADGVLDVYVHFHAPEAARRGLVHAGYPAVYIGVERGEGSSAYRRDFEDGSAFVKLLAEAEARVQARYGARVKLGGVMLSSWSAGYGAVLPLARRFPDRVRGVVLLDSLYGTQQKGPDGKKLPGTVLASSVAHAEALARRAVRGEVALFLSYSDVPTIGYASTGEVASYLTRRLGLTPSPVDPGDDPRGPVSRLDRGDLHLRGFRGSDARAHCRHLALVGEAVAALRARWPGPSLPPPPPPGQSPGGEEK